MKKLASKLFLKILTVLILGVPILNSKHPVFAQVISPVRPPIEVLGNQREMLIGTDYYPEHWPKERWETDLKLMKEAGFNVVRLAEFAWVLMEPTEGQFEFGWLDEFLALADKYEIKAILGTPTAVMPAWVARKYPETLATKKNGQQIVWGSRKNNCFSNGTYRLLSERITRAMAQHFKNTPNVIGWQTDNEFAGPVCFCDRCRANFQDWLRNKYGTLEKINESWGTHFWGHKVQTWGEIQIPDCDSEGGNWNPSGNPSACYDWRQFNSWLNVRFQHYQVKIIREVCPEHHFVTHNLMGFHSEISYYDLGKDLDFVSWDNYPVWYKPTISYDAAMAADLMRGIKQKNFLIMEQTAGPCGWGVFHRNTRPGEIRKIAYQQLAHGADGQIWFRWRTCTAGREQYWHGLLGHDGKPLRRYKEAAQVASEYRKLEKYLRNTTVKSEVAIIYDYHSIWSLWGQPGFEGNNVRDAIARYYNALFRAGINVDMINPEADLSNYKLVLTPDLIVLPDELAEKLNNYVKNGGVLLTDCRTGVKDETNLAHERTLPGLLSPVLGIEIEEYGAITADMQYELKSTNTFAKSYTAVNYCDWITPKGAEVLAGYEQWHLKSFAAVTRNSYGQGKGWYVGTVVKEESFYDELITKLLADAGIKTYIDLPIGVEASIRQGDSKKLLFLINHTEESRVVKVPAVVKKDLLSGEKTEKNIELGIFGVAVIEL
jgi:beta-galactosidase